ncbi:hypothetical protein [Streptomyces sp. NPDC050355]|uniref:hypothetical protein n=1 Tax=Streptomyces sp. NPDC050355 TaxID=3365609 RepID=UPI0037888F28
MTDNAKTGQLESGRSSEARVVGADATVTQGEPPRVPGRLDAYRSRCGKWHRQVKVEKCPGCGHPHLHRAPLPLVRSVVKTGACGATYIVQLRVPTVVAA